jgi:hypothetical protein
MFLPRASLSVHFISQFARAFERYHPAGGEHQIGSCGRIAAATLTSISYAKLVPKALTSTSSPLSRVCLMIEIRLSTISILFFSKTVLLGDDFYDLCLG